MNWTWIAGGFAAVLAVGGLLYFFGFAAVLKLAGDAVRFVAGSISRFLKWQRVPGNGTKSIAAVLAFMSLTFGIQSMQRGHVIIEQQGRYTSLEKSKAQELADAERARLGLVEEVSLRDQRIEEFRDLARQQMALLDQQKAENKDLAAEAAIARAAAAKSAAAYQREFQGKPPECAAALQVMAKACPTLQGY